MQFNQVNNNAGDVVNERRLVERPSGLIVPEPKPEPPKPLKYFTVTIRRGDDFLEALAGLRKRGAELVSVARHGEGGGICFSGLGYVVVYLHDHELHFSEKT